MNEAEHRALTTRLQEILSAQDYARLDEIYTPDVVVEYPQSGERFRGVDSLKGMFDGYPGQVGLETSVADVVGGTTFALTPMYTVVAVEGSGDRGTAMLRTRYPDGTYWWVVTAYELTGSKVSRARIFFAEEFEAPAWREPFWDGSPQ